jgi:hypothetical protein
MSRLIHSIAVRTLPAAQRIGIMIDLFRLTKSDSIDNYTSMNNCRLDNADLSVEGYGFITLHAAALYSKSV